MELWLRERNFDDTGAYIPRERDASGAATAVSTIPRGYTDKQFDADAQWQLGTSTPSPLTPTPASATTPQELHTPAGAAVAATAAPAGPPSFETYLSVPLAFVFQCTRSRADAALLYEVTCVALEMDVLMESVHEQLHDRQRISDWLHSAKQQQPRRSADVMETALFALQQQASGVSERSLLLLLERLQQCLQKLYDLQFPLAQSIESNEASACELEDLGSHEAAARRWKLVDVQVALLQRIEALQADDTIPLATALVTPAQLQQQSGQSRVCWPAASNSEESARRSTMDDVQLSTSPGSLRSPLSAALLDERQRMETQDPNETLTANSNLELHGYDSELSSQRASQRPQNMVAVLAGDPHTHSQEPSGSDHDVTSTPRCTGRRDGDARDQSQSPSSSGSAGDHALSESVY